MTAPFARVRNTIATRKRNDNLRFLIGELRTGPMLPDEMQAFLQMSPSGARKYIRDLREAGVIVVSRYLPPKANKGEPIAVYALNSNEAVVAEFLASTEQETLPASDYSQRETKARRSEPAGLHKMGDDEYFKVRRASLAIPKPDPVLAHLFGFATRK